MISLVFFPNFFEILIAVHQYDRRQVSKPDTFMAQQNTLQYGLRSVRYAGAKPSFGTRLLGSSNSLLQLQIVVINSKLMHSPPDNINRLFAMTFQSHQDVA